MKSGPPEPTETARNSHADGLFERGWIPLIPNRSRIIEHPHNMVTISDGPIRQPVSSEGIQLVFVPSSQHVTVAEHKSFEQGRISINEAKGEFYFNRLLGVFIAVTGIDGMPGVAETARKKSGGRAQVVACI